MKTLELDLDKDSGLDSLSSILKAEQINIGEDQFRLRLFISHNFSEMVYAGILLLLAQYFAEVRNSANSSVIQEPEVAYNSKGTYYRLYLKYSDVNKLKHQIESDFRVAIEVEKKNPLDEVFGIWKGKDITIEKIRERAWRRTK